MGFGCEVEDAVAVRTQVVKLVGGPHSEVELPERVRAVLALFVSIMNNLVGNAVEYSPPDREVLIEGKRTAPGFQVSVTNAAPNLRPEDEARLFDRFWRFDQARSAHGHSGLGLPLSRAFAERLGCQLNSRLVNEILTLTLSCKLD